MMGWIASETIDLLAQHSAAEALRKKREGRRHPDPNRSYIDRAGLLLDQLSVDSAPQKNAEAILAAVKSGTFKAHDAENARLLIAPDEVTLDHVVWHKDVNAWLAAMGESIRLPVEGEPPDTRSLADKAASRGSKRDHESKEQRQDRRLKWLEEQGGARERQLSGEWKASGKRGVLAELARTEKTAGHPYSDESDIRKDVNEAAERRHQKRLNGQLMNLG